MILLNNILFFTVRSAAIFGIAKAATLKWKFHFIEAIYLIAAIVITVALSVFSINSSMAFALPFASLLIGCILFYYFYKINTKPFKQSLSLVFDTLLAHFMAIRLFPFIFYTFLPFLQLAPNPWPTIIYFSMYIPAIILTIPLAKSHSIITLNNKKYQILLNIFEIICFGFIFLTFYYVQMFDLYGADNLVAVIVIIAILGFYIYGKITTTSRERQQREAEYHNMQYYMNEIEKQYTASRKYEHDYKNILLSIEEFINNKDIEGLKQYYSSNIKEMSIDIKKNEFALKYLCKIKVQELKSVFTAKLLMAKSKNIDISIEANDEIDHIPINPASLIRMIGIIMDNAIEALEELAHGKLTVSCLKTPDSLTFIVVNTCSLGIPDIDKLKQPGFSTKGMGHGLGLSDLYQLAELEGVILQTEIADNTFLQKLTLPNP